MKLLRNPILRRRFSPNRSTAAMLGANPGCSLCFVPNSARPL